MIKLYNNDCLEEMKNIEDKSIDLVLIDPPYNIGIDKWDKIDNYLDFMSKCFKEIERILKDNGSFYFFHNDINQIVDLLYWIKNNTNFKLKSQITWSKFNNWKSANIKDGAGMYRSVLQCYGSQRNYNNSTTEYIYYFTLQEGSGLDDIMLDTSNFLTLRNYFASEKERLKLTYKEINKALGTASTGGGMASHYFNKNFLQWTLPTEKNYKKLQNAFKEGFKKEYEELRQEYEELRQKYEEERYNFNQPIKNFKNTTIEEKKNILRPFTTVWEYDRDDAYMKYSHLTPKPIKMLEHIIEVSSDKGDVVLDCFMGSGSTGVACKHLNRDFIGIEKEERYFKIAEERIKNE